MKEKDSPLEERQTGKSESFIPGTPAWGFWLAQQAHTGRGLSPTVAGTARKTATKASNIVSPGWKEGKGLKS